MNTPSSLPLVTQSGDGVVFPKKVFKQWPSRVVSIFWSVIAKVLTGPRCRCHSGCCSGFYPQFRTPTLCLFARGSCDVLIVQLCVLSRSLRQELCGRVLSSFGPSLPLVRLHVLSQGSAGPFVSPQRSGRDLIGSAPRECFQTASPDNPLFDWHRGRFCGIPDRMTPFDCWL